MISQDTINVVTSCSKQGWDEYGARFVETYIKHWPETIPLHVVSEDAINLPPEAEGKRISLWSLWLSEKASAFHQRHADNPVAHGRRAAASHLGQHKQRIKNGYNFREDACKFAKKPFAIELVANAVQRGRLFWIDADVVTFSVVPESMLINLLPQHKALCCLDRPGYHSECGFVGYNLDHPLGRPFIREFANLYASDQVFDLSEWHDSWTFDWLRNRLHIPTQRIAHSSRHHANETDGIRQDEQS